LAKNNGLLGMVVAYSMLIFSAKVVRLQKRYRISCMKKDMKSQKYRRKKEVVA